MAAPTAWRLAYLGASKAPAARHLPVGAAAGEVAEEGTVELPVVQLLDARPRVLERAAGDPQELQGSGEEAAIGVAPHQQVALVGQRRLGRQGQIVLGRLLAVHVEAALLAGAVHLGDHVVPLAVIDRGAGGHLGLGRAGLERQRHAAGAVDGQLVAGALELADDHAAGVLGLGAEVDLDEQVARVDVGRGQVLALGRLLLLADLVLVRSGHVGMRQAGELVLAVELQGPAVQFSSGPSM